MDVTQAAELLDGLPLSSSIAIEVFHEAVRRFETEYETDRLRQWLFDAERRRAILTAKFRDEQIRPDGGDDWILAAEFFPEIDCLWGGLSVGVGIKRWGQPDNPEWRVAAWIRRELSSENRPELHELLPLPDQSLSESEWLVVFWAIAKTNRREDLEKFDEFRSAMYVTAFDKLRFRFLYRKRDGDVERFKVEGRDKVIEALLRECNGRSLLRAREKTQFNLIVFDGSEPPAFRPAGWKAPYWPAENNLDAARQWFDCARAALLHWQESLSAGVEPNDMVSVRMARQAREDAWLLACHVRDNHGIKVGAQRPTDDSMFSVTRYLDDLRQAISVPSIEPSAVEKMDESAIVAAKTLREQRDMTAHPDGKSGPDGFYLDGELTTGLTDNELALLKLALDNQPDGPTEDDVCNRTEFKSWTRTRIDKLLGTIKAKFLTAQCPRVLRWANRHLVFREPRQRAKAGRKSSAKTSGRNAGRKPGESLQNAGRHKRRR